jgi:hypothetical protein
MKYLTSSISVKNKASMEPSKIYIYVNDTNFNITNDMHPFKYLKIISMANDIMLILILLSSDI